MTCRLCANTELKSLQGADDRAYYLCSNCSLISASPDSYVSTDEEKARYLTHNNGIDQPGYVEFLNRAVEPALNYLNKDMVGLDYGCGYAPTLSKILKKRGYQCEDYDPYFVENPLNKKYDFIFSTEVFEHFNDPAAELEKIYNLLKPTGLLIIMTERWDDLDKFKNWYYTRDPSHVVFYNNETFDFIESKYNYTKLYDDQKRVTIHKKNS
ncbi:MAG: class I SAM-dependent methyltransferase [Melioribacteraceae bacterium]|nr:class I SAM-dependent methyltransferase [Melioribacteraceae bacterium]